MTAAHQHVMTAHCDSTATTVLIETVLIEAVLIGTVLIEAVLIVNYSE